MKKWREVQIRLQFNDGRNMCAEHLPTLFYEKFTERETYWGWHEIYPLNDE